MVAPPSVVDSDDSSESHPSTRIVDDSSSSSSSSSASTSSRHSGGSADWAINYRDLPRKQPLSLRFVSWAAGRPRHAHRMKKKSRADAHDRELFRVSTTTLLSSMLGPWPTETKMYWVTGHAGRRHSNGSKGGNRRGDEDSDEDEVVDDDDGDGRMPMGPGFFAGNGMGSGNPGPPFAGPPGGIPPPPMGMNPRFAGPGPRFPPGMSGIPPPPPPP